MSQFTARTLTAALVATLVVAPLACTVTVAPAGSGRQSAPPEGTQGPDGSVNDPGNGTTTPGDTSDGGDAWEPPPVVAPELVSFSQSPAATGAAAVAASAGGTVAATGTASARLEIPAGTLAGDANVSLTLLPGQSDDPYALAAVIDTGGVELGQGAELVITLDPPLPEGESLRILDLPAGDPNDFYDTGLVAELSADRSQAIVPIELFAATTVSDARRDSEPAATIRKGGAAVTRNCHGHTLRRIVQGLIAEGLTADQVYDRVAQEQGNRLTSAELQKLQQQITLSAQGVHCYTEEHGLQAVLDTFYTLEPVSENINGRGNPRNPTLENVDQRCLADLANFAGQSRVPPVVLQGRRFTKDAGSGFYTAVAHSTPIVRRGNQLWIENGLALGDARADNLIQLRQNAGEDTSLGAVISVPFHELNTTQRNLRSGEAIEYEFNRLGDSFQYDTPLENRSKPWVAQRWYFPRPLDGSQTQNPAICSDDAVEVPEEGYQIFRITNYGSQPDGYFTILTESALDNPPLLSGYPGGGLDPELRAELTPLNGDVFATREEAAASICSGFSEFFRPALASFILAGVWNGERVGVDQMFQDVCQ